MGRTIVLGVCLLAASGWASAASITVYGTGFTNTGALAANGANDGNWTIVSDPDSLTLPFDPFVTDDSGFPFSGGTCSPSCWLADTTSSQWISPQADETTSDANSSTVAYVYQETFTIAAGFNPATAQITGDWTADNYGYIVLNGVEVDSGAAIASTDLGAFTSFVPFTITSNFKVGTNTLQFYVFNNNNGSPDVTGLDVEITSATVSSVPEPMSLGLAGLGLGAVWLMGRRRKRIS